MKLWNQLTPRQREVATQLALGNQNAEIANALGISIKTVDTHRGKALGKLDCRNNVDLARLAIREGVVSIYGQETATETIGTVVEHLDRFATARRLNVDQAVELVLALYRKRRTRSAENLLRQPGSAATSP